MPSSVRNHIQSSFSGGEISPKMLMQANTEVYQRSVLSMVNFIPTMQGSAKRSPGTRFLRDVDAAEARIIPYLTTGNERSLVVLTPLALKLITNVTSEVDPDFDNIEVDTVGATITYRKQIIDNPSFYRGEEGWDLDPVEYTGKNGDGPLGVFLSDTMDNTMMMVPRLYKYPEAEASVVTMETTCEVDVATDTLTLDYNIEYIRNPPVNQGGYTFKILVSPNSDYTSPVYEETFTQADYPVGSSFKDLVNADLPTAAWTGTLYIKLEATALDTDDREYSNPQFAVFYFRGYANGETTLTEADLVTPYTADDLPDLHFVQSPYGDKELVITHPKYQPHRLRFNTGGGAYVFEPIPFTNQPSAWGVNNYPATCTAYHGRLILAGAQSFKVPSGDPVAAVAETVWGTEVSRWTQFSTNLGVNPDDSIEFTAIYRSPIQWVYGHKTLLVGALECEYVASGEAIFAPGDLGVFMQSTHGSNNVQPAAFGEAVLFASDGGTKVRRMSYSNDDGGWVSMDLTILNPEICFPRIRRMVRLRNPHQMCMVVTDAGHVVVFHSESGVEGWSRMKFGGVVKDLAVLSDERGMDVPFFLIERRVNGTKKLYLEALVGFRMGETWDYVSSCKSYQFETATDTITGLDHLEGKTVIVQANYRYIGFYKVTGGQVVLTNDIGGTKTVTSCRVGLQHRSVLLTLPPRKENPGSMIKFLQCGVRILGSIRPIIRGQRPADRDPESVLNRSENLDLFKDVKVTNEGYDQYYSFLVEEHLPFPLEILGVYGRVEESYV